MADEGPESESASSLAPTKVWDADAEGMKEVLL